jgi:hypothetical protein
MEKVTLHWVVERVTNTKVKYPMGLHVTIYGLELAFFFCNLLARVYNLRPHCSQGSAFGHESAKSVPAQSIAASC